MDPRGDSELASLAGIGIPTLDQWRLEKKHNVLCRPRANIPLTIPRTVRIFMIRSSHSPIVFASETLAISKSSSIINNVSCSKHSVNGVRDKRIS